MLYNLGFYRRLMPDLDIRIEGYYNATDNYISSEDHAYPLVYYADNIDKVWTRGAELEVNRSSVRGPGVHFNYNLYLMDWFDDSLEIEPFLMEMTPRHRINAGITWTFGAATTASLEGRSALTRSSRSGLSMNDFLVLGAGLEQRLFARALAINARIENILDAYYEEIYGYPMPGRTFALHASMSF
jgi:outer membrane receptor protein involved in Fe transport